MNRLPERCSEIKQLNILVQVILRLALDDIRKQGVDPLVVETYRDQIRQNYLYCQKRTIAEVVAKGINPSFAYAYCNPNAEHRTTDTLNSVHTTRKAVDVVPQRMIKGKNTAIWDRKDRQTQIIIKTMTKYGFESGANWKKFIDSPHYQAKGLFTDTIDKKHTTTYITKSVQTALGITVDGKWGKNTSDAVNKFLTAHGYNELGADALKDLLIKLA